MPAMHISWHSWGQPGGQPTHPTRKGPNVMPTTDTINDTLRRWREEAHLDLDEVAVRLRPLLGKLSRETVRRYETTYSVEAMNAVTLAALVRLYGHTPSELPADAAERIERLAELFSPSGLPIDVIGWSLWDAAGLDPYAPCAA